MKSQHDPGRSKSRHQEYSLILPILALVILNLWGNTSNFAAIIIINLIALVGILSSAFSVVRHADVLAHRLGEPYGSLILSLSVVVLEVSLISAMMATGDAAPALMRDTLYSIIMIVIGGLVGVSLLLGGRKFATQHVNLVGIKQYLMAIFPLAMIVLVLPGTLPGGNFTVAQSLVVAAISAAMYGVFLIIQTKTHQSLFVYEHEDEGDDPHHGKPSSHSNLWHTVWLLIHLIAVIAVTKFDANPLEALLTELNAPAKFTGFLIALLILSPEGLGALKAVLANQVQRAMNLFFGSVLATISLTVPAVTLIAVLTGQELNFGLEAPHIVVMVSVLILSKISFSTGRTNVLNGTAHLALFAAYMMTIML
ncbi:sodium-potassium/proton antiporter ChaA [Yersinia pseudotuberculosis]|uniref:Calcium/sodium:proton antiporter n=2 Tax=Yersinia pseudotuberculosis complex TaxID=1649845 RepID=A0A0T9J869_YERPU|nr:MULTISPECIES: sodium-potassium/proton antiporter ChaA [Yersinia pseudotuberculosis complex]PSH22164.1 sodium-potassium/proton antiporter ChaA [Yersinia pseudotuberculosis]CNC02788.1 calcium/sodium:proton antiporter [Yersinia pseudotuberculosis]CNL17897.1 calcium/sodium:proton antiporter [Yersinia pseudotuberculosis]CRG50477.1 calcium/sodium:proton antiporter [Yersinia wautersii]SUP82456.1 calcium/sodium:proton antiporter [Yersinia pseudotuberculosis]